MQELKIILKKGIYNWEERIKDFQLHLPYYPWVSDECAGLLKLPYGELKMIEILKTAILWSQHVKLNEIEWVIQDNLVQSTITKWLEDTLFQEAHSESCTVTTETKIGIGK